MTRYNTKGRQDISRIANDLANSSVQLIYRALDSILNEQSFQENPDIACSVLCAKTSNELVDYYRDYFKTADIPEFFEKHIDGIRSQLALALTDETRRLVSYVLKGFYPDGMNSDQFRDDLKHAIRLRTFEIISDVTGVEEDSPNVTF